MSGTTGARGRPLMTAEQHAAFVALRAALHDGGVSNIANVFVPVGPPKDDPRPCLMYVGRATHRYGDEQVATFEGATERDLQIIAERQTPYWAFVGHILRTVTLEVKDGVEEQNVMSTAWSNLAKIGDTKGKPTPLSCSIQAVVCRKALRFEIDTLKPAVIVVATGRWQEKVLLDPVFEDSAWSPLGDACTRMTIDVLSGALVIHTYHPERKRGSRDLANSIGRLIADRSFRQLRLQSDLPIDFSIE